MVKQKNELKIMLVDLGTTTIAVSLFSYANKELTSDEQIQKKSLYESIFFNPQINFGTDVISRITASLDGKKDDLQNSILFELKKIYNSLSKNYGNIDYVFIAGNTTMIHLLMGYDCSSLSRAPFKIEISSPGIFKYKNSFIYIVPWLSSFIGGDVMSGMIACNLWKDTGILIDLGTNAELIIHKDNKFFATSTAAGSALEGIGLSCGTTSIDGAICAADIFPLQTKLTTINNKIPTGICGSGAISICAQLLKKDYINHDGILTNKFPKDNKIFLAKSKDGSDIYFSADDLRKIQLSIAAIAAGIDALLKVSNISPDEINNIYISGGLGYFTSKDDLKLLGLLSNLDANKAQACKNSSLLGIEQLADSFAKSYLQNSIFNEKDNVKIDLLSNISKEAIPIDKYKFPTVPLANYPFFKKRFIDHLKFPNSL